MSRKVLLLIFVLLAVLTIAAVNGRLLNLQWYDDGLGQMVGEGEGSTELTFTSPAQQITVTHIITQTGQITPMVDIVPVVEGRVTLEVTETPVFVDGELTARCAARVDLDFQTTAAEPGCLVYLPLVVVNWRRPWNLLLNPGFEEGFDHWAPGHYPPDTNGEETIETQGCLSGKCLRMQHNDATWQGTRQGVGPLVPGGVYEFKAWFKTAPLHYGYINLHDPNWKDANCEVVKRSITVKLQGTGEWQSISRLIRLPETDDCGESTAGHAWSVYLYSYLPVADNSPVYYDDVSLVRLVDFAPPEAYPELEEQDGWTTTCQWFSDGYPLLPCHDGFVARDDADKVSGEFSMVLTGTREKQETYAIAIPVKPDTTYRLDVSLKIADRAVYNYLNLLYPAAWTQQREGIRDIVEGTKGIWSGMYALEVDGVNILPNIIKDAEYRSPSDVDWFHEQTYFRTRPDQVETTLQVRLQGFEGKLYIDGLTLQKVESAIDDAYFHIPLTTPFKGMRIRRVARDPLAVETSVATFSFSEDAISLVHANGYESELVFPAGFLEGLAVTEEPGNVVLENDRVLLSIGADNVVIGKFKAARSETRNAERGMMNVPHFEGLTLQVQGPRPAYHNFEAGIVFATDYSSGLLFSPLRTKREVIDMPYRYDGGRVEYAYLDADFEEAGLKHWNLLSGFDAPQWAIEYTFRRGEGFIAQLFPARAFDTTAFCKERMYVVSANTIQNPAADFSYSLQKLGERANIALVWMSSYAASVNDQNPPDFYCKDDQGRFVHCDDPNVAQRIPVGYRFDVTGPYTVGEPAAFRRFVDTAHAMGMKVVVYMSPDFYYTSDVETFLANLNALLTEYAIDGVYYDGMYGGEALRSLELARKTRDLLGDRFYAQHISWERALIRRSAAYRAPFLDDKADLIWNGEGVKRVDEDTWRLNYCGRNVNNTPSTLLAELRPVDYSLPADESVALSLSPEEQIDRTLACTGTFWTNPYSPISSIYDKRYQRGIEFDADYFWEQYNGLCLGATCGDGVCDTGETYYTCPGDCAPRTDAAVLTREGDTYTCDTDASVAQWLVDGTPFYALHFTFDDQLARDDSAHRMNPSQALGVSVQPPTPATVDGRQAFAFDGSARLYGDTSAELDLVGKDFSAFAAVKTAGTVEGEQVIFALDAGGSFRLGIAAGKLTVSASRVHVPATAEIVSEGCFSGQCLKMQHNDATWQGTRQGVGTLTPGETYTLTARFKTAPGHRGYINLYDSSWGRTCGGSGKSFVATLQGTDDWENIQVQVTVPAVDDCGQSTADDEWQVYLYGHDPREDNSPVFYDDVVLTDGSGNLLVNPSFEDGLTGWTASYYVPPFQVQGTRRIDDGAWHTVGLVYQRPWLRLYVDGVQETEAKVDLIELEGYGTYSIGARSPMDSTANFRGIIDDLFVADRALTDTQVEEYHTTLHRILSLDGNAECVITVDGGYYLASHPQ